MASVFELPARDFNYYLAEQASMGRPQAEIDDLRRRYRDANSFAGKLKGLLAPEEGRSRSTYLPVDAPQGMSIFDALISGQASPAIPQGLIDAIVGGVRGVESPAEYAKGIPPRVDAVGDAFATAASAMAGGGAAPLPKGAVGANRLIGYDNPQGDWLQGKIKRAEQNIAEGGVGITGPTTAYTKESIMLPVDQLSSLKGAMGENPSAGQPKFDDLMQSVQNEGFRNNSPILVGVNHRGEPYIVEGNNRVAVAKAMGIDRIPAEVRWYNGGEDVATNWSPQSVENMLAANASKAGGILGSVAGKAPNKEDLDPLGYQKTKMRDYLTNTQLDKVDLNENLPRIPRKWEEMENKLVLPFYGDRTSRGYLLSGIDDVKFDRPVYTEGGVDFKRGPAAQTDRAIWASNSNIIKRIADEAEAARRLTDGEDVYGITGSMAPDANDFATMTGSAMAEMVKGSKITRKGATEFNDMMRAIDPTFVGIRSPKLREWVDSASSPMRKSFIRLMDSNPMQAEGFPSPAQVRYSVTDPTQRDMSSGMFGLGVSKIDDLNPILRKTLEGNRAQTFPHSTYNTQITGDYFGSLPPVPQGLLFKDVYDAMEGGVTKAGQPYSSAHKTHAIKTKMPVQRITPEVLDGILRYFANLER